MMQLGVTLHHLAPDAQQAGAEYPDLALEEVPPAKLRVLLERLAKLAPRCEYPLAPELRIAGPRGRFVVHVRAGQVHVTSWAAKAPPANLPPEEILDLVTRDEVELKPLLRVSAAPSMKGRGLRRKLRGRTVLVLVAGLLLANSAMAWYLTKPKRGLPADLLPAYRVLDPEPAKRVVADFVGIYETSDDDSRSLKIASDGRITWVRFGVGHVALETQEFPSQAAKSGNHSVLVTSNLGMIELSDPITLTYFGDTYRRKSP